MMHAEPTERDALSAKQMNAHEARAWRRLLELGAERTELGGKPALDLSHAKPRDLAQRSDLIGAVVEVAGRSGCNRRHVDRRGNAVYVVTDDPDA
jgi:hypothetical protein